MTGNEIRKQFIDFFKEKDHVEVRSAPVIPFEDPTLLFTNAGMNQFKDIFLGKKAAQHKRVVNSQKCIRAGGKHNDLEEVGLDGYHHTFFEMLGNWSFGDYYKKEAIIWAWELLTKLWKIPAEKLYATVHQTDDEAYRIWEKETDIDKTHIEYHGDKDNFWEMGETGPCGPCSEIHIDYGEEFCNLKGQKDHQCRVNGDCHRFFELWNLVFIQFFRDEEGKLNPLEKQFVDTGAGFERLCQVLQHKKSNYDTDVFQSIIKAIIDISGKNYEPEEDQQSIKNIEHRVIADHIRTLCIAIADGGYPSNDGRGYVLRRILRRAARFGRLLGLKKPFLYLLTDNVIHIMGDTYPELKEKEVYIKTVIKAEEERFNETLDKGLEKFAEICKTAQNNTITGKDLFILYDTFGFPPDLTELLAREKNMLVDQQGFAEEMEKQRQLARESSSFKMKNEEENWSEFSSVAATEFMGYKTTSTKSRILKYIKLPDGMIKIVLDKTPFYHEAGGQVADKGKIVNNDVEIDIYDVKKENELIVHYGKIVKGEISDQELESSINIEYRLNIQRNHTATHLLHAALREVFGPHIQQKGSLVAADHLRFDFTHFKALDEREIEIVEKIINQKVRECIPLHVEYKQFEEAKREGAIALFGEKYEDQVRAVKIGDYSHELCGGTHIRCTGEIGLIKIISESASASGIRRIVAITGSFAEDFVRKIEKELSYIAGVLNVPLVQLTDKVIKLSEEHKKLIKEKESRQQQHAGKDLDDILATASEIKGIKVVTGIAEVSNSSALRNLGDVLKEKLKSGIGVLGAAIENKASFLVVVTSDLTAVIKAGDIAAQLAVLVGGKGGGRPDMAMSGGKDLHKLSSAIDEVANIVSGIVNKT
ncbi:MAG: alanine--tRNA ligase [Candidatus Cloacimonetes bacterium]|nr:alanine--tRNA ligase [Candidatus Cloacimonadota bacterium]